MLLIRGADQDKGKEWSARHVHLLISDSSCDGVIKEKRGADLKGFSPNLGLSVYCLITHCIHLLISMEIHGSLVPSSDMGALCCWYSLVSTDGSKPQMSFLYLQALKSKVGIDKLCHVNF